MKEYSGVIRFAKFEVAVRSLTLGGNPVRAPLIMDQELVSCVKSSAGTIEVFSPSLHKTV